MPKIVCPLRAARTVICAPQTVEQLVEAPTVVSLVEVIEQPVQDSFPPRLWSRTWTFQFLMVVIASVVVFSVYTHDRVQQRLVEQSIFLQRLPSRLLTFQFRVVAEFFILHSRLPVCRIWQINGFFALFPVGKKVRGQVRTRGRNWVRTLLHPRRWLSRRVSSGTQMVFGWTFQVVGGNFWARIQKFGGLGDGWDGALVMRQPTFAFGRTSSPTCSRISHL